LTYTNNGALIEIMHQFCYTITYEIVGSTDLYKAVRAGFINQGTSLNKWCIAKGLNRQTVEKALRGERRSRLSRAVLSDAVSAAGICLEEKAV
jgi:hypothetical protein